MNELVKALLDSNRLLTEQVVALSAQIAELAKPAALPPGEWIPVEGPTFASTPLHVTEEEEELRHAHTIGQITKGELEEALRGAGFAHTDIDVVT